MEGGERKGNHVGMTRGARGEMRGLGVERGVYGLHVYSAEGVDVDQKHLFAQHACSVVSE